MRGVLLLVIASVAFAQRPQFEVATIRPISEPVGPRIGRQINGHQVSYSFVSMRDLVAQAYSVHERLLNTPEWMGRQHYEITGLMPESSNRAQLPAMLQELLRERFNLQVRTSSREEDVFALVVGRNGHSMKPASAESDRAVMSVEDGHMRVESDQTMAQLAATLSSFKELPVLDFTGLAGAWAVTLDVSSDAALAAVGPNDVTPPDPGGTVAVAIEKLGLRLEKRRAAVVRVTVESAEKLPTEN